MARPVLCSKREVGMTRPKSSGFTLIETLVSMALAVVLILGTAGLLACSLKAKKKGDLASGLTQASAARIEALKAVAFDGPDLIVLDVQMPPPFSTKSASSVSFRTGPSRTRAG